METVFDLANDLLYCQKWDPDSLPSPYANHLPEPECLPDNAPFGKAEEADIALDKRIVRGTEGYLDDGAVAVVDGQDNKEMVKRAQQAVPMSLHLTF